MGNHYVGRLILASNSQARAELLAAAGIPFVQQAFQHDEPARCQNECFEDYLMRLSRLKADAQAAHSLARDWILAADTAILFQGQIIGKPGTASQARRILGKLQGKTHVLATAVCVLGPATSKKGRLRYTGLDKAVITLRRLSPSAIRAYIAEASPLFCAGAYALQGKGAAALRELRGDPSTVIGLPLTLTERLLRRAGFLF